MIYTYYCSKCNKDYEHEHRINETPTFICLDCNLELRKNLSGKKHFILSGPFWSSKDGVERPRMYKKQRVF